MTQLSDSSLSPSKQALLKIRELKQELSAWQRGGGPIAIVSMACRFPGGANTPEAFWQQLLDKTDVVTEIPSDRWDLEAFFDEDPEVPGKMYARRGAFVEQLDQMDPEFFGISPREATWVDPQQRLLMEVGWEALERAGWPAAKIGSHTGIFVGWMHNDYQNEASDSFLNLNPYIATGAAGSFLCGRLAYYLGLEGPSVAVDTACSSSLVALHLACQSLARGDCDRALVGGVNAIVSPTTNILTCKLQALSPKGHSRAFDAAADGYLRGEGCGVVTLRRLSDAQADGDPILGVIRGSAVGHNGFSSGLTAPNPKAQEKVIRQALERADVSPREILYLEAHGTGTELGDPLEMQAAAAALTAQRAPEQPLLVGSVKTNIGHLEAAAGIAGLIKTLLAMEHQQIPAHLNFEQPNPHIPWDKIAVRIPREATDWPPAERCLAGVSAFGMSGTNAHVVVEGPPPEVSSAPAASSVVASHPSPSSAEPQLLVLSGRTDEAVAELADRYARRLASDASLRLNDVAYTAGVGRTHMPHRAALIVDERQPAIDALKSLARGVAGPLVQTGGSKQTSRVAWQFTGQGSQYAGMGRQLYDAYPVYRAEIDHCEELLREWRGESLVEVMFRDEAKLNHTSWTQPAIFALQRGLVMLLRSWGCEPAAVLGHSVGEYAAACTAGVMEWDDGLRLISERGRLIGELPAGGSMLAVFATADQVAAAVDSLADLSLAALNGSHVVVSGPDEVIAKAEQQFGEQGVRTKRLTTSHAFHSSLMTPAQAPFAQVAGKIGYREATLPLVSNVSGDVLPADRRLDGAYWADHIRQPVRYAEGVAALEQLGVAMILEVGPQAVLSRMAASVWKSSPTLLPSCLQREAEDRQSLLQCLGSLYVHGATPDFEAIHAGQDARRVVLPTYPFQRRRFWGPAKPRAAHAAFHTAHPLLGEKQSLAGPTTERRYQSVVESDSPPWLPDHEVMDQVVFPGAAWIEIALAAADGLPLENIKFEEPLVVTDRTAIQTVVATSSGRATTVEAYATIVGQDNWKRHATADVASNRAAAPAPVDRAAVADNCPETIEPEVFYGKMAELGLHYGPAFRPIESIAYSPTEVLVRLAVDSDVRGYRIPPPLLDGALHSLAVGLVHQESDDLFLPIGVGRLAVYGEATGPLWCHGRWNETEGDIRTATLSLFDEQGRVVVEIVELRVRRVSRSLLQQMSGAGVDRLLHELTWETHRPPAPETTERQWLIVRPAGMSSEASLPLARTLRQRGCHVDEVALDEDAPFEVRDDSTWVMDGRQSQAWNELFSRLSADAGSLPDGVAWLLGDLGNATANAAGQNEPEAFAATKPKLLHHAALVCEPLLQFMQALRERGKRQLACGIQLITRNAVAVDRAAAVDPEQTQFWGLGRVIGAEEPGYRCRLIDLAADEQGETTAADATADLLLAETRDSQFAIRDAQCLVPRITRMKHAPNATAAPPCDAEGAYLVTGGLGMLGREAAAWLARLGAGQVVVTSRRPADEATQQFFETLRSNSCEIVVQQADVSSPDDVAELIGRFGSELKPLRGMLHIAGVLDDALLPDQSWSRFEKVLAPKVAGARLLDLATRDLPLDFFILYSSAAAVLGSPGQSNYATANAFLDGLAWERRAAGLPAVSINWGPWSLGMADDPRIAKRLKLQGIEPLTVDEAHEAMQTLLAGDAVQATVLDVDWRRMARGMGGDTPALFEHVAPARQRAEASDSELVAQLRQLGPAAQKELLTQRLQETLGGILGAADAPETDRPLIEMGLDSLMAVEFGAGLQQLLGDQFSVGPAMLFDHPTIDAIADHVLELVAGDAEATPDEAGRADVVAEATPLVREDIAVIGMSCRFPGAENVEQFWKNLEEGVDAVRDIPADRWDVERFYSPDGEPGKMNARAGGFLDNIGDFDASFFNIGPQEACWMDPQHRLLLENSYHALEDAAIALDPLPDANVGVFMGIMGQDYAFLPSLDDVDMVRTFQGAGLSHSAGVGRISYAFGFEGPSVAVDTASSSSLVAVLQAVRSLQEHSCNVALAGGVNAILAPVNSLLMSTAGLLAPDGRCKSFSADANGFGRGEGCGVVVLKRLSDARRDGDRVLAVIRGGAVVHNGASGGITTPSRKAQIRVIRQALEDARVTPAEVQYLEAHGTGTEYGDPLELEAAASVYAKGRSHETPLLVGSVKANISHLEAAGGISGFIKTVLALAHGKLPPQIHCREPSPHIPWQRIPVKLTTEPTPWPEGGERLAAVTALGLVGTNAHLIVGGATQESLDPSDDGVAPKVDANGEAVATTPHAGLPLLLPLSARSETALACLAESYQSYLEAAPQTRLEDVAYTLGVGRRHLEFRATVVAESLADAQDRLAQLRDQLGWRTTPAEQDASNGAAPSNGATPGTATVAPPEFAGVATGVAKSNLKIAWVFTQADHPDARIRELVRLYPQAAELIDQFSERLAHEGTDADAWSLDRVIRGTDDAHLPDSLQQFCLQACLYAVWRSWGGEPDILLGSGVGQISAACAAGGLDWSDGFWLAAARERLARELRGIGVDLAAGAAAGDLPAEADEALDRFEAAADTLNYYPPSTPLICSLTGELVPVHRSLGGSYWRRQAIERADLDAAWETAAARGCDFVLNLGDLPEEPISGARDNGPVWLATCLDDCSMVETLLAAASRLYVAGGKINFANLSPVQNSRRVSLPKYPFQRQRYWITELSADADRRQSTLTH